jgi:glycosyltransferase involved in cell wall biosynthesis
MNISVVIPTYNRARKIATAVESVLAQTLRPHEVLVIDDGSTDDTAEALAPLKDRIRYIRKPNGGASSARNLGILEARCDWIAFLDSDDAWDPSKLAKQSACVACTGAKVCFCVCRDESGRALDDLRSMDPGLPEGGKAYYPPGDCRLFKHRVHPLIQSMLASRVTLIKCGLFDETLHVAEDTKLVYRLILDFGYAVVNEKLVLVCRERSDPGLSDTMDPESAFRRFDCYTRVQAEVFWRVAQLDSEAAGLVRRRMFYFASRQAEIACALGRKSVAKRIALSGLDLRAGWKCMLRNLIILTAYDPVARKFAAKWRKNTKTG